MKITSEVTAQSYTGDRVIVKLTNVRLAHDPEWRDYCPEISLQMSVSQAKHYPIGRKVTLTVTAK